MKIDVEKNGNTTVVKVDIDYLVASNITEFRMLVAPVLKDTLNITMDMSKVELIDSTGLGAIMAYMLEAKNRGATLSLCGLSKAASSLCHLARTDQIMDIFPSRIVSEYPL